MRLDVGTRTVGTGVIVTDESDGGHLLFAHVGFQGCIQVSLVVEFHVVESFAHEFLFKILGKNELFVGTWDGCTVLSRLSVKLSVV